MTLHPPQRPVRNASDQQLDQERSLPLQRTAPADRRSPRRCPRAPPPRPCRRRVCGQSRSGLPRSSMSSAVRPGLAPTLASSPSRICVLAVGQQHRGDIQLLARLGPQRLHRVHRRTVGLQLDHPPARARRPRRRSPAACRSRSRRRSSSASHAAAPPWCRRRSRGRR